MTAAFACAPPLRGSSPSTSVGSLSSSRPRVRLSVGPRGPLARATAAMPEACRDTASAGKLRASAVLLRELPRLLQLEGGPREMFRGGEHEMFDAGVEFSFPMWNGKGRKVLKMLLMSLPLQASCGFLWPVIEDIQIASPSRLRLDVSYIVRCSTLGYAGGVDETDEEVDDSSGKVPPRSTTLQVRTRLRFDEHGRIAEWRDTWNKGVRQFLAELADLDDTHATAGEQSSMAQGTTASTSETDSDTGPNKGGAEWSNVFEEEESSGLIGQRLASRITPGGPPLSPEAMAERVTKVESFLRVDYPRLMLPKGNEEKEYALFHSDSVLETYDFVVEGVESLALLHRISRADMGLQFSAIEAHCLKIVWQSSKTVVGRFMLRARRRVGGCFHQSGFTVSFQLNASGEIVLCKVLDEELQDDSFDIFALRSTNRTWIW